VKREREQEQEQEQEKKQEKRDKGEEGEEKEIEQLHLEDSLSPLGRSLVLAARAFGAQRTFFLVNGSTQVRFSKIPFLSFPFLSFPFLSFPFLSFPFLCTLYCNPSFSRQSLLWISDRSFGSFS
jgi:hypothetical protein